MIFYYFTLYILWIYMYTRLIVICYYIVINILY